MSSMSKKTQTVNDRVSTISFKHLLKRLWLYKLGVLLFSLMLVVGCSSDGSSNSSADENNSAETGQLALALTDAEGDFLTYVVNISSIVLTRQNGAVVEVLPINTSIDFAQYVEVSEILTMATIPAGVYTAIELQIDYSNANVTVQDSDGNPIVATLVDNNGDSLEQLTVSLELTSGSNFVIRAGTPAHVTLDLDLDASNQVVIDNNQATVTVDPVLLADTQFELPKSLRLRGLLDSVDSDNNVFSINLLPFRHRQGSFGTMRVHVDNETRYEINGVSYDADAGFAQLSTLPEQTKLTTEGDWIKEDAHYSANTVLAGSSVPWGDKDIVRGVVVARSDNTLTVRGAMVQLTSGKYRFNDTLTLTLGNQTTVTQQLGDKNTVSTDDISIGSAIKATGLVVDSDTLDVSEGHVRIRLNNLAGSVISVNPLSVDLQILSGRSPTIFDFTGTGTDITTDSDPENYQVNTSNLKLKSINLGDPVRIRGLVSTFGTSPEDFFAKTVIDVSEIKSHMTITYGSNGSDTAIAQADNENIVFDLSDSGTRHHVIRAGVLTDLSSFNIMPVVIPSKQTGIFALTRRGKIEIHRNFSDFITALNDALASGERVTRLDAHGHFNDNNVTMQSKRLRIGLTQ